MHVHAYNIPCPPVLHNNIRSHLYEVVDDHIRQSRAHTPVNISTVEQVATNPPLPAIYTTPPPPHTHHMTDYAHTYMHMQVICHAKGHYKYKVSPFSVI